ncbi:MAG: GDSL-type esterase/lipase family protein [Candidatus Aenigmatarchaeota archaeon]
MARLLVFGDSIAWGYYDIEGGWVERLKRFFMEKMLSGDSSGFAVYNLSISGDYTKDLLDRFRSETKQRTEEEEGGEIIIFNIGINDSQILNKSGKHVISKDELKRNIKKLIDLPRKFYLLASLL